MLEQDVRQWMWVVQPRKKFVRDLMPGHFNRRNVTTDMQNEAPLLAGLLAGTGREGRFDALRKNYEDLVNIGLHYRPVQGTGYLRLVTVRFPAEWGEEIARDLLANATVDTELGTGREILAKRNKDLAGFVAFCLEQEIGLDMGGFVKAFKDTTNNANGLRIGTPDTRLVDGDHNFLDRRYVVQNSVIAYGGTEAELETLLAQEDLFRDTVRQLHCSDEGQEWTFVKANNAGRARGTYENFDLFAVSKVNLMGRKAIRSSVFELKKDNSAQSLYTALTQAISYRNRRIANYVWIIAPGFNAEQFVGSNFDGLMKQCIENGIGVLDIVLSTEDGNTIENITKRLDAKWSDVEDPRVVNTVLQESRWFMCPLCQEHYQGEQEEGATRFCPACTDALRELVGDDEAG